MSEITLSLEHPSLGCGEIIARYDLSEIQEKAYQQGRADAECEYTSKVFERLREVDADYISIDHLIEVLEWAKEQLNEQN